ncbi:MAG: D-alanine--D-alanine ligase [Lachnospiraceae bacterium]|nr:D-alanine--D-alanine ligase [Lachnospiraceae bacterium]
MKIKVGVFFGGDSVEHEVSVISGIQAVNAFNTDKYEAIPIYITKNNELYVGEGIGDIARYKNIPELLKNSTRVFFMKENGKVNIIQYPEKKLGNSVINTIDVAFPVVHGRNVEDGCLQGFLNHYDIPYAGCDVASSAVCMDKYVMKTVLADNDIPVLPGCVVDVKAYQRDVEATICMIEEKIGFPVIVKPINLGSSVGIKVAKTREELVTALDYGFAFTLKVLVEKAIMSLREINCAVLGDYETAEASECEEPVATDEILSYEDKYVAGEKGGSKGMRTAKRELPANLSPERREEVRAMAVKAFQVLGCSGVARIDFMIDKETDKLYVNELNTIPGSLAFYLWEPLGKPYAVLIENMIDLALKRAREDASLAHSFNSNLLANANLGGTKGTKR